MFNSRYLDQSIKPNKHYVIVATEPLCISFCVGNICEKVDLRQLKANHTVFSMLDDLSISKFCFAYYSP